MSLETLKKTPISENESAAAKALTMKLKRIAPEISSSSPAKIAANSTDDIDDMWDNMPV